MARRLFTGQERWGIKIRPIMPSVKVAAGVSARPSGSGFTVMDDRNAREALETARGQSFARAQDDQAGELERKWQRLWPRTGRCLQRAEGRDFARGRSEGCIASQRGLDSDIGILRAAAGIERRRSGGALPQSPFRCPLCAPCRSLRMGVRRIGGANTSRQYCASIRTRVQCSARGYQRRTSQFD